MNDSIGCNSSTCPTIGSQSATVCLPVSISPYAVTGPACVKCRGSAVINHTCMDCKGIVNGKCDFVISQKIQIDLPVEFGATVKVGDTGLRLQSLQRCLSVRRAAMQLRSC